MNRGRPRRRPFGDGRASDLRVGRRNEGSENCLINTRQGPAGRSAGSLSWAGLANTYFWLDPTRQVAGVILTQSLPFVDPKATAAAVARQR